MSKKTGESPEKLLKEALVPEDVQPYQLPGNWVWVYFGSVAKLTSGYAFKSTDYCDNGVPIIRISDLNEEGTSTEKAVKVPYHQFDDKYLIRRNDLLIAMSGSIGKMGVFNSDEIAMQNQRVGKIESKSVDVLAKNFMKYFIFNSKEKIIRLAYGGTQPNVSSKLIETLMLPLPPINEQKRIVDKVERLLDKINQAKQLIEEAKETFELRRAAILDRAYRGELTSNWRDENKNINFPPVIESLFKTTESNEIPNNWAITNFDSIAANERYALAIGPFGSNLKVTDYREEGVPLIFVRNIRSSNYGLDNKFVSEEKAEELKAHMVESGDILITKMGDPPGDVDICPEIIEKALITADCIKVRVNTEIVNRKYLLYAIKSDFVQSQIRRESKGVAQQKISLQAFRKMNVIIAPYEEQLKIVEELEGLMEKEKGAIENLELMEWKLNSLVQAILSKAFRGQLGTSDPYEENAIDFLQQAK